MAIGLGFKGGILGFGVESVFGTPVAPTKFIEINSDGLTVEEERLHSEAIPQIYQDDDEVTQSSVSVSGEVETEMRFQGMELLLKHAMGAVATVQVGTTTAYDHTFTLTDDLPVGLTFEVDRDISAFTVFGGKINTMAMSIENGGFLKSTFGIVGKDMTAGAITTPTLPTAGLINFSQGVLSYGGATANVPSASFSLNNNLKTDRRFIGSRLIAEPQRSGKIEVTGTFSIEFEDLTKYNDFRAATSRALILTFTGGLIESGYNYTMTITFPVIKLTSGVPMIGDAGIISLELPFKAYATSGSVREFNIILRNTLTAI